ncbi:MAG: hypothetical protein FWF56_05070 [Firmicutes bacterium]|nr:hypothetical protein [Bacillota bacterium]MCL1954225.1 hypothetical protein [Bacillota bacterium]
MTNRRIFYGIISIVVVISLLIFGNMFFSVRNIFVSSATVTTQVSRVEELNIDIANSNIVKKGQSMFSINIDKATQDLEKEFFDIRIVSIEKSFPQVVYIEYELLEKQLEIFDGVNYFQLSSTGIVTVLDKSGESQQQEYGLVKIFFGGLGDDIDVGSKIVDARFLKVVEFIECFLADGPNEYLKSGYFEFDLNYLDDTDNSRFLITTKSTTDGYFEIYEQNNMRQAFELTLANIGEIFGSSEQYGKVVSIKNNSVEISDR